MRCKSWIVDFRVKALKRFLLYKNIISFLFLGWVLLSGILLVIPVFIRDVITLHVNESERSFIRIYIGETEVY